MRQGRRKLVQHEILTRKTDVQIFNQRLVIDSLYLLDGLQKCNLKLNQTKVLLK